MTKPGDPSAAHEPWSHPLLRALIECIRDARSPQHEEIDALTDLVWHQALARRTNANRRDARIFATAALCGNDSGRV